MRDLDIFKVLMEFVLFECAYGYRAYDSRNNLFYITFGDVVYFMVGLCVVYNR